VGSNPTLSAKKTYNTPKLKGISMPKFASSVRFQTKKGQENAFIEANLKFNVSNYTGCLSHQCINAGNGRFQSVAVWESEDALVEARPLLIKFLDTLRPMLAEISPELGVTDPISGNIIEN
tara:strand:+ start:310 stop:672 length:363 start_codon:yes stop_codon:yes gene_type:complete